MTISPPDGGSSSPASSALALAAFRVIGTPDGMPDGAPEACGAGAHEVLEAIEILTGAPFILKVLRDREDLSEAELRRRFEEAAILRDLKHPNLVSITQAGPLFIELGGETVLRYGFAMPRIPNVESLAAVHARLTRGGENFLRLRDAVAVVSQICNALNFLHTLHNPVIHRDLSFENVLVDPLLRQVFLCDFGLAKVFDYQRPGLPPAGTLEYKSPEVIAAFRTGENALHPRDDVWSAGVILYRLLTNEFPFHVSLGDSAADCKEKLSVARLYTENRRPSDLNPAVRAIGDSAADDLDGIVSRALAFDPNERHTSRGFGKALNYWLDKFGAPLPPGLPPLTRPVKTTSRKWLLLLPAACLAAGAGVFVYRSEEAAGTAPPEEFVSTPAPPKHGGNIPLPNTEPNKNKTVPPPKTEPPPAENSAKNAAPAPAPPLAPTPPPAPVPPPPPPQPAAPPPPRDTEFGLFFAADTKPEVLRAAGLETVFYDLAKTPAGDPVSTEGRFWANVLQFVTERQWNDTFLSLNFFRAADASRAAHVFVPRQPAANIRNSFIISNSPRSKDAGSKQPPKTESAVFFYPPSTRPPPPATRSSFTKAVSARPSPDVFASRALATTSSSCVGTPKSFSTPATAAFFRTATAPLFPSAKSAPSLSAATWTPRNRTLGETASSRASGRTSSKTKPIPSKSFTATAGPA
jgi:hypothetical protein